MRARAAWRRVRSASARIAIRLLAFNLLLAFLPFAGLLYLDTYERHLLEAQERAMVEKGRIFAGAVSSLPAFEPRPSIRSSLPPAITETPGSGSSIPTGWCWPTRADSQWPRRSRPGGTRRRPHPRFLVYRIGVLLYEAGRVAHSALRGPREATPWRRSRQIG